MTRMGPTVEVEFTGRIGANVRNLEGPCRDWLSECGKELGLGKKHVISLMLCDRPFIRELNAKWRDKDVPTDVLSFPQQDLKPKQKPAPGELGDIAIAISQARQDARIDGIPFDHHLRHLLLHGLLHLLGYDHQNDAEAEIMETLEARMLETL